MKSSNNQFSNISSFYPRFLLCTILLTLIILGVTVSDGVVVNNNTDLNYDAVVSTFTISHFCLRTAEYRKHAYWLENSPVVCIL